MIPLRTVRFSAPIRIMPPPAQRDLPSLSDEELVALAQKGDMPPFEELVFRHRDKVYARAYLMMHQEDAALDASQAAWVKGWQRLAQFKGDSSFSTWMTRVVINVCLDDLRKQKRVHLESIEEMDEETGGVERQMPIVTVNPTEGMEQDELRKRIDDALENSVRLIGLFWYCMNLKDLSTKKSAPGSESPSEPSCPGSFTHAGKWPPCCKA